MYKARRIYYLVWDYNWLSVRSLDFFDVSRKKGDELVVLAPYKFDWLLNVISFISGVFGRDLPNQIKGRQKIFRMVVLRSDRIIALPSLSYLFHLLNGLIIRRIGVFNINKEVIEQKVLKKFKIDDGDVLYATEGAAFQLFSKANPSKNKVVLESQAVHIDSALDIEQKFTNLIIERKKWWYEKHRKEVDLSDHILTYSDFQKRSFVSMSSKKESEVSVVPLSSRFPKSPIIKKAEGLVEFLFVGRVGKRKGVDKLLSIWGSDNIAANLHIVGKEDDIIIDDSLNGINYYGYQNGQDLVHLFQKCHVFVFPTLNDSFGMVIQEALSFNMPVITTYNCGASVFIQDGKTGLVYNDPFDTKSLEEAIISFIVSPELIEQYSKNILHEKIFERSDEIKLGKKVISKILI